MKYLLASLVLALLLSSPAIAKDGPLAVPEAIAPRAEVGEPGPAFRRGAQDLDLAAFVAVVMQDANVTWATVFEEWGYAYVPPRYVAVGEGAYAMSNCGINAGHPADHEEFSPVFYCSYGGELGTQLVASSEILETTRSFEPVIYVSLPWLEETFGSGDVDQAFAVAYLLTQQFAIHVEYLLGYIDHTGGGSGDVPDAEVELRADCLSGIWAFSAYDTGTLADADIEAAQAAAWGDMERLPEQFGRSGEHGSPDDQLAFFTTGYTTGNPAACFAMETSS